MKHDPHPFRPGFCVDGRDCRSQLYSVCVVLLAINLPGGLAWAILPIDPLVDRFVTALNVFANLAACSESKTARAMTVSLPFPQAPSGTEGVSA